MDKKFNKQTLEQLILVEKQSYAAIGRNYNVSDTYIKKICKEFDIILPVRNANSGRTSPKKGYRSNIKTCKNCNQIIKHLIPREQIFCNAECAGKFKTKLAYDNYYNNQEHFKNKLCNLFHLKHHFLKEQNHKCSICNIENCWNGKILVFVLDHIDGNAANNIRENLRLICPNCDSQLETYKKKNKNSARKERYINSKNK